MEYKETAKLLLKVLCQDLELNDEEELWRRFKKLPDKYHYRPSTLLLALIELKHPEKKELVDSTFNVTRQTINRVKKEICL